jgi:hypothetical protein
VRWCGAHLRVYPYRETACAGLLPTFTEAGLSYFGGGVVGTTMEDVRDEQIQEEIDEEKARKRSLYQKFTNVLTLAAMAATIPALATFLIEGDKRPNAELSALQTANEATRRAEVLQRQLKETRDELTAANARLAIVEKGGSLGANSQTEIRLASLEKKLGNIEQTIMDDPTKALQLPLLRRDLEAVKENTIQANATVKQSVDQIYDLNKWLLGSMAVGVILLALSHFFRKRGE